MVGSIRAKINRESLELRHGEGAVAYSGDLGPWDLWWNVRAVKRMPRRHSRRAFSGKGVDVGPGVLWWTASSWELQKAKIRAQKTIAMMKKDTGPGILSPWVKRPH